MRKIFFAILFLILFFFTNHSSFAAGEQTNPTSQTTTSNGYSAAIIDPSNLDNITEGHAIITAQFNIPESEKGKEFFLCQESDCGETSDKLNHAQNSDGTEITDSKPKTTSFKVFVCGADPGSLQTNNCENNDTVFYGGYTYYLGLVKHEGDTRTQVASTNFYVKRLYPTVEIHSANDDKPKTSDRPKLTLSQTDFPFPEDINGKNFDYKVQVLKDNDTDYNHDETITLNNDNNDNKSGSLFITKEGLKKDRGDGEGLDDGTYLVKVIRTSTPVTNPLTSDEFLMYTISFSVSPNGGQIGAPVKDPEGKDKRVFSQNEAPTPTPPPLPCIEGTAADGQKITIDPKNPNNEDLSKIEHCTKVATALGDLQVTPIDLISTLLKWTIGIAGGSALFLFIYAGYVLMTSAGNKEKVQQSREIITSAIIGLLFIIFSAAILEFIGVDILRIPGFGK